MESLQRAIKILGNQAALAKALKVTPMAITNWKARGVPAKRCSDIQRITNNSVTCEDLRPDIFRGTSKKAAA
jgi:DNA-binding transcriptional regulator YdaS (Cro superfamily)